MAFSINRITLLGNLTREPELKMSKAGKPILKFSIATNHSIKKEDGSYKEIPTFHNVVVFGSQTEWLSKNMTKGTKCYVDGRLSISEYTDKDGVQRKWVEVFANNCIPTASKGAKTEDTSVEEPKEEQKAEQGVKSSDIPF